MRCPRCGAVLRDDAEQCGFCGEKIVPVISFEKPIIENRPRDEAFDVENTVQKAAQPEERNHDQNPLIIMIIILSGVLLAAVAVLLFYAVRNSQRAVVNLNQTSSVSEETATETTPPETATSEEEASAESMETPSEETETEPPAEGDAAGADASGQEATQAVYDDREYGNIIYRFSGNQAVVIGCNSEEGWLELPETVYGTPVVGISEGAFTDCEHLMYIDLPEGVAWIGAYAFKGCTNFKEIVLPDSLVTIGDGSFNNCPSFTIVCHTGTTGYDFAMYHQLNWIEGDFLVPIE